MFLYFCIGPSRHAWQNVNSRQHTHKHTHNTVFLYWLELNGNFRLHSAARKVCNSVTYLITLSSASLSYYKFSLELFDRTAYEYANSSAADAVPCFIINLHVFRIFSSRCSFSSCPFSLFLHHQLQFSVGLSGGDTLTVVWGYCSLHAVV